MRLRGGMGRTGAFLRGWLVLVLTGWEEEAMVDKQRGRG